MRLLWLRCILALCLALFLGVFACSSGGGGDDNGGNEPTPPTVIVDTSVGQPGQTTPGPDGTSQSPVATIVDSKGHSASFVEDELWLSTNDDTALAAFLARWNGVILLEFKPADYGITGLDNQYLIRVNVSSADTTKLTEDLLTLDPNSQGDHSVSSENGLRLLSAGAHEAASGLSVGFNWIGQGGVFWDRVSMEGLPAGNDSNAFTWSTHSAGSVQDIGVAEAWRAMEFAGKLDNRVKIAILDMGFQPDTDFASPFAISNVPFTSPIGTANLGNCGGPCPWHGTNVMSAAMARANNNYGAAGTAGPVADPVLVFTFYDFFTANTALAEAYAAGARIANMSFGASVPAILGFSVAPFDFTTAALRASGMLLFAAAGNDGGDVDATDCFIVCWEETWVTPCENHGVTCVGGIASNSTSRASGSNYGSESVDIFAPYTVWVGPDPVNPASHMVSGTSFSSPFTAGVAALVWASDPSLSASQVENILMDTARTSPDRQVNRIVHAYGAVHRALGDIPPGIRIVSPASGTVFIRGTETAEFEAESDDYEDETVTIIWSSSLDGDNIGMGTTYSSSTLSIGSHVITATATDSAAHTASDSVNVTIVGATPVVTISSISPDAPIYQNQSIFLTGTSYDPSSFGPLDNANLSWTVDGSSTPFGGSNTGPSVTIAGDVLSVGDHTITLTGTNGSETATDSETITIVATPPGNTAPTAVIDSPANGTNFLADTQDTTTGKWYKNVTLCGHGEDPQDGQLWGSHVQWDTRLYPGGGAFQTLGPGGSGPSSCPSYRFYQESASSTYEVRLTVTDSGGLTSSTSILITIYGLI